MENARELVAVVYDSSAKMPSKCWGVYRHVAVMICFADEIPPRIATSRSKAFVRWEYQSGPCSVGKTNRCAYARASNRAHETASEYNRTHYPHAGAGI